MSDGYQEEDAEGAITFKDADGNIVGRVAPITSANGNFYQAYKRETLELLSFIENLGQKSVKVDKLNTSDRALIERHIAVLREKRGELFPLLAKRIDENNPSFFDECTIENVWTLFESILMIGQYIGLTGQRAHIYIKQANHANKVKVGKAKDKNHKIREAIIEVAGSTSLSDSDKFAESIEDNVLTRLGVAKGKKGYSRRTIQRQISAILEERGKA